VEAVSVRSAVQEIGAAATYYCRILFVNPAVTDTLVNGPKN